MVPTVLPVHPPSPGLYSGAFLKGQRNMTAEELLQALLDEDTLLVQGVPLPTLPNQLTHIAAWLDDPDSVQLPPKQLKPVCLEAVSKEIDWELEGVSRSWTIWNGSKEDLDFTQCKVRPRLNHWHAVVDGFDEPPLPEGFRVQFKFRDRTESTGTMYGSRRWDHLEESEGNENDIIAFRIIELVSGFCFPWEVDK